MSTNQGYLYLESGPTKGNLVIENLKRDFWAFIFSLMIRKIFDLDLQIDEEMNHT